MRRHTRRQCLLPFRPRPRQGQPRIDEGGKTRRQRVTHRHSTQACCNAVLSNIVDFSGPRPEGFGLPGIFNKSLKRRCKSRPVASHDLRLALCLKPLMILWEDPTRSTDDTATNPRATVREPARHTPEFPGPSGCSSAAHPRWQNAVHRTGHACASAVWRRACTKSRHWSLHALSAVFTTASSAIS